MLEADGILHGINRVLVVGGDGNDEFSSYVSNADSVHAGKFSTLPVFYRRAAS